MTDILERLYGSSVNESSHELYCRCISAANEIERLRYIFRQNILRLSPDISHTEIDACLKETTDD